MTVGLDWEVRSNAMQVHTALHLLSVVLSYPVTGGSIGDGDGRLDFDIPEAGLDRAKIADELNALIARDATSRPPGSPTRNSTPIPASSRRCR